MKTLARRCRNLRYPFAVCLIALAAWGAHEAGLLSPVANRQTEIRFEVSRRAPTGNVVLVDIDSKSIAAIGQWPWPRSVHAGLIRALTRAEASEIAFDVDFSARSTDEEDGALEAALREAQGSVILSVFNQTLTAARDLRIVSNRPLARFAQYSWPASGNVRPDADGRVRRFPYGVSVDGKFVPSLPAIYGGMQEGRSGEFLIDFSISATDIDRVSAIDLLHGEIQDHRVAGKKVIIGASAIELRDFFEVPVHGLVSGALLQALSADTLLQGRALRETGHGTLAAGLFALSLLGVSVVGRLQWRTGLLVIASSAILIECVATALQVQTALVVDTSTWQAALLGFAVVTTAREIDFRQVLLFISKTETRNIKILLNHVISENLDGIIVIDGCGTIQSVSRAASQILQPLSEGPWEGRKLSEFAPPELAAATMGAMASLAEGSWQAMQPRELTLDPGGGTGERTLEYVISPSRLAGGFDANGEVLADQSIACLTFRDITERQQTQARLAQQTAELEAAEQVSQAKSEFLASMSHEIRTPLHGILGFADLLLDKWQLLDEQRRCVEQIRAAGSMLLTVVNDVLDFSKIEAGQIELEAQVFSPAALLDSTISLVGSLADQKGLSMTLEASVGLPEHVSGDPNRLRQVLLNLLNNAVKFTPTGGVTVRVHAESCGDQLRFCITDTGIGIPAEKQDRLFQRFSQVDGTINRKFGGTGLGLAISKQLVELMGGQIGVESELGQGSTFWFTVPLSCMTSAPEIQQDLREIVTETYSARILVVDDVEINREIARTMLEAAGHTVEVVGDGADAVAAVQANSYELVLMDVQMPGMDGLRATQHIRGLDHPARMIPIIAVTANVLPQQIRSFKEAGMDDHIGKPFKRKELFAATERWLGTSAAKVSSHAPDGEQRHASFAK
jgi:signal transduction histidine kinase/CheY-like chemotaxis protein/CHASE2 domain-containing sensor protein